MTETLKKQRIALRNYLHGRGFNGALRALNMAEKYHFKRTDTGEVLQFRKDLETPEFHHQVRIALTVTTFCDLIDLEGTIITGLLHDTSEDYGVSREELTKQFGHDISNSIWLTTKKFRGEVKNKDEFFRDLREDFRASIVKGVDRYENFQSMIGVFNLPKQNSYISEGEDYFLPMLDDADSNFPEQHASYMSIRHRLKDQIAIIKSHILIEGEVIRLREENQKLQKELDNMKRSMVHFE
jgi:(p)ppGpp synthase/HD superfamily hydrolase